MNVSLTNYYTGIVATYKSWVASWGRLAFIAIITSLVGLALVQTEIADAAAKGETELTWQPWVWTFSSVYSFTLVAPLLAFCCQQWSLNKQQLLTSSCKLVALYIPITFIFISLMLLLRHLAYFVIDGSWFPVPSLTDRYVYEFPKVLWVYIGFIFINYTKIYYDSTQKEQLNAAQLENQLQAARMQSLRNQLQPHFLFNTLNLISGTVYQDAEKADSLITRLGDLLRYSLTTEQKPLVRLEEEMAAMKSYLEISALRFEDKMALTIDISDDTKSIMIPAMLLQPLLENAVKYGIEPSADAGKIALCSVVKNEELVIVITNPRCDLAVTQASFNVGLQNARNRLNLLYANRASINLKYLEDIVELTIVMPALKWKDVNDQP